MRTVIVGMCLLVLCVALLAQQDTNPSWAALLRKGKVEEARNLCGEWLTSGDTAKKVEAHKCLANVALTGQEVTSLEANDVGGGTLGTTYKPEAAKEALFHLNQALQLDPQDLSVHKGRLYVLKKSVMYSEMAPALEESVTVYKQGHSELDEWLPYVAQLFHGGHYRAGLGLLDVLNKHYPNSHEVLGNIGAMHLMLKEDDQALPYLKRAVELAPTDPIDTWNLGREYDYLGNTKLADEWYQKALTLETDVDTKNEHLCTYGVFLEEKVHDLARACDLEQSHCPADKRKACSPPK